MLITDFIRFSDFFAAFMREKRETGSHLSYRNLSKALGYKSTSNLAMISIGRRYPNSEKLRALCEKIGLDEGEIEYAGLMISHERSRTNEERELFWSKLNRLRPTHNQEIDLDRLAIISEWQYLLLICLAGEKNGIPYPLEKLSKALKGRISTAELSERVEYLKKHGFLEFDQNHELLRTNKQLITANEVSSNVIKSLHKQMLKIAGEEVYQQDVDQRFFSFLIKCASPSKLSLAKDLLNKFRDDFDRQMTEEDPETPIEVYQLGLSFFRLTDLTDHQGAPK